MLAESKDWKPFQKREFEISIRHVQIWLMNCHMEIVQKIHKLFTYTFQLSFNETE